MYRLMIYLPICMLLCPSTPNVELAEDRPTPGIVSREPLPVEDPVAFLEKCLDRYDEQRIQSYKCILQKQERIDGKLMPREEIQVAFREQPHSVFMHWLRGSRRADSVLYVAGENNGKMLVHPSGLAGSLVKVVTRDVDGPDAKQAGRYTLDTYGMKNAVKRSLKIWKAARDKGELRVQYLGVRKVREAGDKLCYALRRTSEKPEEDGVLEGTFYFDKDTWLEVGIVQKGEDNKLIGEYMFRDIEINPKFSANQFSSDGLLTPPPGPKGTR